MDNAVAPADLTVLTADQGLCILGVCPLSPADALPEAFTHVALLGPASPDMWHVFAASPEAADGQADPMDRWSRRVASAIADRLGGQARFPSDGPPYPPFLSWAQRTGRAWPSPVGMLVHEAAGLMVSFRAAIALPFEPTLPAVRPRPCDPCGKPCLSACPVGALTDLGYDVPACRAYLNTEAGRDCLDRGCAVRRSCPVSWTQPGDQSRFHMKAFHR